MKKLFLFALAGMMMFAFTQCGGAFSSAKSIIKDAISGVEKASTCEELEKVENDYNDAIKDWVDKYQDEGSKFSDEEDEELSKLEEEYWTAFEKKEDKLCD